jgi:hypothetical protein
MVEDSIQVLPLNPVPVGLSRDVVDEEGPMDSALEEWDGPDQEWLSIRVVSGPRGLSPSPLLRHAALWATFDIRDMQTGMEFWRFVLLEWGIKSCTPFIFGKPSFNGTGSMELSIKILLYHICFRTMPKRCVQMPKSSSSCLTELKFNPLWSGSIECQ